MNYLVNNTMLSLTYAYININVKITHAANWKNKLRLTALAQETEAS